MSTKTWNQLVVGSITGTRVSPEIGLSAVQVLSSSTITWVDDTPTGTSITVETNIALDGVNYAGWQQATNGNPIPGLNVGDDLSNAKLQLRYTLSSTDTVLIPRLNEVNLRFVSALPAVGYWTAPAWDLQDKVPGSTSITWSEDLPAGTSLTVEVRASDDGVNWGTWTTATKNAAIPVEDLYVQARVVFTSDSSTQLLSPKLTSLRIEATDCTFRGVWESDVIDCSQAKDKSTGKIVTETDLSGGTLRIQSASSPNGVDSWTPWSDALADGTLTHNPDNHIKLRFIYTGLASIHEATLSLDGEPTATVILSGMTPNAEYDFTTLRDILIIANGKDAPRKWTGIGQAGILGGNPPVLSLVETHLNRVWGVEVENPSRVRFSEILDPETWDVLDFIDFNPEDGDYITALYRYGQYLIVSKRKSMAILTGNQKANYSVVWLEGNVGAQGHNGITAADKYIAFVAQDGIRFSDLTTSVLATERLLPDWEKINKRRLNQAAMYYWRNMLLVALPSEISLHNDTLWVYDFLRNAWSIYTGWNISDMVMFNQYGEDVLLGADSTQGQVYQLFESTTDIDGSFIEYEWQSKEFDFGYPERYKLFRGVYLDIEGVSETSTLYVTFIVDGKERGTYTTTIPAGEGDMHSRRILPPLYDAVLGSRLSLKLKGRVGIREIVIEFIVRGVVVSGEV